MKMAKFLQNNNIFEFNNKTYQQKSSTAIENKFAPLYGCIYMDQVGQKFIETKSKKRSWMVSFLSGIIVNRN